MGKICLWVIFQGKPQAGGMGTVLLPAGMGTVLLPAASVFVLRPGSLFLRILRLPSRHGDGSFACS